MEYLHRRKESPMQGMSGLWGGVGSNLVAGGSDIHENPNVGYSLPLSGGTNWFSPGFYGVEQEATYMFSNTGAAQLNQIYYQRLQNSTYNWWFLVQKYISGGPETGGGGESGTQPTFEVTYGARIQVPNGSGTGQEGPFTLATEYTETFGETTIAGIGSHYLGWHSGVTGESPPTPPIYADDTSGGSVHYLSAYTTTPSDGTQWTSQQMNQGEGIHIHVTTT